MKNSEYIENFLDFLRTLRSDLSIAQMNEDEANKETQDILHRLELIEDSEEDTTKMVASLKTVRQKRRNAKDVIATARPVLKWADNDYSYKALQNLEKCLGEVRKAESELENRHYLAKTDIVSEALGCKDELWVKKGETKHGT